MLSGWITNALSGDPIHIGLELLILGLALATFAHLLGSRSRGLLHDWATHGGWEIVGCRRCLLRAGDQFVIPGLPVYRVAVRSQSGRQREAFVRIGNMLLGTLSDEVAVEWVEPTGR